MLVAIIGGLLGLPPWLVVVILVFHFWSRHRFQKMPGVFPFKGRIESGSAPGFGKKYPWRSNYAFWIHDVLLVHKGFGLIHTIPLGVAEAIDQPVTAGGEKVKGLGDQPVLLRFRLDSGAVVRLVVRAESVGNALRSFSTRKEIPPVMIDNKMTT